MGGEIFLDQWKEVLETVEGFIISHHIERIQLLGKVFERIRFTKGKGWMRGGRGFTLHWWKMHDLNE